MTNPGDIEKIEQFIKDTAPYGVVVGISGGIDSAVVAHLAVRALGKEEVFGLILPMEGQSMVDAVNVTEQLGIGYKLINIQPIFDIFRVVCNAVPPRKQYGGLLIHDVVVEGNLQARIRMCILYATANTMGRYVIGTTNLAEMVIGYFTKYGDGGVDFEPIAHLLKSEVRELARDLGVNESIINKAPAANLGISQTDEEEMGFTYDQLDNWISGKTQDISMDIHNKMEELEKQSEHKRHIPRSVEDF